MSTPMSDAQTARLLGDIGVAGLRKKREADAALSRAEAQRGTEYRSRSGRHFRARFVVAQDRATEGGKIDGRPGDQLLLALCDLHEKPARRRADRDRGVVLAEIARRGESALDLGEAAPKRGRTAWLVYESMGGERLATELRHLTAAEAEYVKSMSIGSHECHHRKVVWPSQSTAPILRVDHEDESDIAKDA